MAVDTSLVPLAQEESTHKIPGGGEESKQSQYNEQEIELSNLNTEYLFYSQTLV